MIERFVATFDSEGQPCVFDREDRTISHFLFKDSAESVAKKLNDGSYKPEKYFWSEEKADSKIIEQSERFVAFENKGEFQSDVDLPYWGVMDKQEDRWTSWVDKRAAEEAAASLNKEEGVNHLEFEWYDRDLTFVVPVVPAVRRSDCIVGNVYYVKFADKYFRAFYAEPGMFHLEDGSIIAESDLRVIEEIVIPEKEFNTLADCEDGTVAIVRHKTNTIGIRKLIDGTVREFIEGEWRFIHAKPESYKIIQFIDEAMLDGLTKVS